MIINAISAGDGAQIVKFNVASNTEINTNYFTVSNVKAPSGKVTGFFISAISGVSYNNMAVSDLFKESSYVPSTGGQIRAILYKSSSQSFEAHSNHNSTFSYEAGTKEFKFKVSAYDQNAAYLPAGDYQLTIW